MTHKAVNMREEISRTTMSADPRVAELREEARQCENDADPRVAYFATWLGFWMDAHDRAMEAWAGNLLEVAQATERLP